MPRKSSRKRLADEAEDEESEGGTAEEEEEPQEDMEEDGNDNEAEEAKKEAEDDDDDDMGEIEDDEDGDYEEGDDDDEEDDDDDDDDDDDEEGEDEAMPESTGSPSPVAKKDMFLRSGRRKRRRSKETSGLTPEQTATKRMRVATTGKKKEREEVVEDSKPEAEAAVEAVASAASVPRRRKPRVSTLETDITALAAANEAPGASSRESVNDDRGKRLFDSNPPMMATVAAAVTQEEPKPSVAVVQQPPVAAAQQESSGPPRTESPREVVVEGTFMVEADRIYDAQEDKGSNALCCIFFLLLLPFTLVMWPIVVWGASLVSPPGAPLVVVEDTLEAVDVTTVDVEHDEGKIPESVIEAIETLKALKEPLEDSQQAVDEATRSLHQMLDDLMEQVQEQIQIMEDQSQQLDVLENLLVNALEDNDLQSDNWKKLHEATGAFDLPMIDLSSITLWEVEDPNECEFPELQQPVLVDSEAENKDEDDDPFLTLTELNKIVSDSMLRARMSAYKYMESSVANETFRKWVGERLRDVLLNDNVVKAALKVDEPPPPKEPTLLLDIDDIIQRRLEIELSDRTGQYDHGSLLNGARVIYGGPRGTSKSLVDHLPLFNRLMQLSQLKFYGYGPEAAITPTYPTNALGQCWSFRQTTIKEQLQEQKKVVSHYSDSAEGFKKGNFGTLTIRLPSPLYVHSVVIEHPPMGVTDQINSAIRNFRVLGYEHELAKGKAWLLGNFEYSITDNKSLQEFEVVTQTKGQDVPPLHSITIAVDSNWGLEYACLYRLRVHGKTQEELTSAAAEPEPKDVEGTTQKEVPDEEDVPDEAEDETPDEEEEEDVPDEDEEKEVPDEEEEVSDEDERDDDDGYDEDEDDDE